MIVAYILPFLFLFPLVARNNETIIESLPEQIQDSIHMQAHHAYHQLTAYFAKHTKKKKVHSLSSKITNWLRNVHATNIVMWYLKVRKNSSYASPDLIARMRSILSSMGAKNLTQYHLKIYADVDRNGVVFPFEPNTIYISQGTLDTGSQDIIDFTIAHECSHILYETPMKVVPLIAASYLALTFSLYTAKQTLFPVHLAPSIYRTVFVESLKTFFLYRCFRRYLRYREKRADLNAAHALGSAYGGIIDLAATYLLHGTDANDAWHPTLQERIAYLYDWECQFKGKHRQ